MDTIYKTFKAEVTNVDREAGTIDMYIPLSTASIDRDGESINPESFRKVLPNFMKHPVLVSSHNYGDLTKQIGEWTNLRITQDGLKGKPKYYVNEGNPEADWAFNLASKGRAAYSVGFIPDENSITEGDGVKTPKRTYNNMKDLLEISQCIIPSNRDAIQTLRSKAVDPVIKTLCDEVEKEIVTKPETTDNTVRIPVDSGNHDGHKMRTITISDKEGIQALYCVQDKTILTYIFSKDKGWNMDKAKKWVADHEKKSFEHEISQAEIIDEIDYLKLMIDERGLNEKAIESFKDLIKRLPVEKSVIQETTLPVNDKPKEKTQIEILNEVIKEQMEGK